MSLTKTSQAAAKLDDAIAKLRAMGNSRYVAGLARYGIRGVNALGVSTPDLRRLARELGTHHKLALALWKTGIHDARHLAAMIAEKEKVTPALMERWARDFNSWDVVDSCCCYLFVYTRHAWNKAVEWARREEEFTRRAGFALMAYLAVHDKSAPDGKFLRLLPLLERFSYDDRNFVKKAVNWALRQIGKRNPRLNRAAIACARRIRKQENRAARWIAADALRELESAAVQRRLRGK